MIFDVPQPQEIPIPRGWSECPPEYRQAVLEARPDPCCNRFVDQQGRWVYEGEGVWERVDFHVQYGPETVGRDTGAAVRHHQDGLRFARFGDRVIASVANEYYSYWEANPGYENHDICLYCGTSNGLNGEYRQGWDCYHCQSN